jgi:hypothetical protein
LASGLSLSADLVSFASALALSAAGELAPPPLAQLASIRVPFQLRTATIVVAALLGAVAVEGPPDGAVTAGCGAG